MKRIGISTLCGSGVAIVAHLALRELVFKYLAMAATLQMRAGGKATMYLVLERTLGMIEFGLAAILGGIVWAVVYNLMKD